MVMVAEKAARVAVGLLGSRVTVVMVVVMPCGFHNQQSLLVADDKFAAWPAIVAIPVRCIAARLSYADARRR